MASERQHVLSPLGPAATASALSSAHPSSKSIAAPESAIPPSSSPAPSPLGSPPLPSTASARYSHLRPTFTLDDPTDDSDVTHDGSSPAVAAHGSRRDVLACEQQKSRPASTKSAGPQPSTRSADGGARLRPRSHYSDRRPENYESRPATLADGSGPTEKQRKTKAEESAPAKGTFGRLLHQVVHNPVFPLDWVGPALSKRSNLKVLFRCTLSVSRAACSRPYCAPVTSPDLLFLPSTGLDRHALHHHLGDRDDAGAGQLLRPSNRCDPPFL